MANVIQNVPDGCKCIVFKGNVSKGEQCIFLDRGEFFMRDVGSGYTCRRYPNWELAVKHEVEERQIHKCPPCLKETVKENI